jgi:SAM-dependent methyltransferase
MIGETVQSVDSKQRFSNRVENYVKYRPDYPAGILPMLRQRIELTPRWTVADLGSGTGISARMFLENGNEVLGVEPNADMRAAAEVFLKNDPRFRSIDGAAEATTLAAASIDLVVSAQAFHWFDLGKCKPEFRRILKPGGWCMLIWNERKLFGSPFLEAYEALLTKYGADYLAVRHERINADVLREFFAPNAYESATFAHQQLFDLHGLIGRCLSSSYAPAPGQPNHDPLLAELRQMFSRYQTNGQVAFEYQTQVYWSRRS